MIIIAIAALLTAARPTSTELTVYNQGFGFVKEVRSIDLKPGRQTVAIEDVAAMIDPTSVGFRSLTDKGSFDLLEQNYRYDLISPEAILNKSVGQRLRFIRTIGNTKDVLDGVLLSAPTAVVASSGGGSEQTFNGMVIRTDDGRIVLNPTGEVEVQQVPAGLISTPTLFWDLDARRAGPNSVELSYITQGMHWEANYVMTLGDGNTADLQAWVTLNNQSGATYDNAKLKLLAGDVNIVAPKSDFSTMDGARAILGAGRAVRNKETKQISLLEAKDVPFVKKLVIDSMQGFDNYYPSEGEVGTGDIKPQVRLEFTNDEKSNLGIPLPKGKFRIYQRDKEGSVQLLGEDQIDHTPRNEHVSLVVGRSFDIVATRKRTDYKKISDREFRETFAIEIRNRKETPDTVFVLERHWGDWHIVDKSQDFTKLDAQTIQFGVPLQPNQVRTVTYTVDTKF
jgi:hypothetical protein